MHDAILKLHGSVNFPRPDASIDDASYNVAASLDDPFILPPIFNKISADAPNSIWRAALQRLREARHMVFVGYSLPQTDIYMQYFLKAGVGPNRDLDRVIVFDPVLYLNDDRSAAMRDRYESCFAEQLRGRITFEPETRSRLAPTGGTFEHFVDLLETRPNRILF